MVKNSKMYKSIGEVAKEIAINAHTLRFWEKEFKQIKPKLLSGNRRYYSEKDINLLKLIYELLKNQGYTIAGAKKLLNNSSIKLDDLSNKPINVPDNNLKIKLSKISKIIKDLKDLK